MSLKEDVDAMLLEGGHLVTKLDAARRQLETAITMFFNDADEVSQHTLVMAAYGILLDLAEKADIGGHIADTKLISGDELRMAINSARLPQNFFKHADRDPEGSINFYPCITQFWLMDAARLYVLLTKESVPENMKAFFVWFQLRFPELFCLKSAEESLSKIRANSHDPNDFKHIAKELLKTPA